MTPRVKTRSSSADRVTVALMRKRSLFALGSGRSRGRLARVSLHAQRRLFAGRYIATIVIADSKGHAWPSTMRIRIR